MNETAFLTDLAEALDVPEQTLHDEATFGQAWDSLAVMSAISIIDKHYGVTISPSALQKCISAPELTHLIRSHVEAQGV
jgi:acyl carrier protein